jgi:hypothetical protein
MRGRKSKGIKKITNKDKALLLQTARTGLTTLIHAKEHLNYNIRRLDKLVYSGYLIKSVASSSKGGIMTIYRLDRKGKNYIKNFCPRVNNLYHFASLSHDYKLTDIYYNLKEEERETWKTESDYSINGFKKGTPDATIQNGDRIIAIEVITSNYTAKDIELKETFADSCNMELQKYYV